MTKFKQIGLPLVLCILGCFATYVYNFQNPPHFFWDENYYLTGAEKYKNGIFFMQTHPPLGKLLIALGDVLVNPNPDIANDFINFDHAKSSPPGFSFAGYRLFPVLLGAAGGIVFFFIFLTLLGNPWWALSLSSLYIFDNAQIIQSRGAMFDSIFTFFLLLYILFSFRVFLNRGTELKNIVFASLAFGALVTTKDSGFFFAPLLAIGLFKNYYPNFRFIFKKYALALGCFLMVFVPVWCIHFSLFNKLNPALKNEGRYEASGESLQKILGSKWIGPLDLVPLLSENYSFVKKDHAGVPKLNLCKPDENGSPVWLWPLGVKAINYRWETTDGGHSYKYLNIVANPASWLVSLLTLVLIFSFLINHLFSESRFKSLFSPPVITLIGLYLLYLGILNSYDRVFFLYSYFPALNISFILLAFLIRSVPQLPLRDSIKKFLPVFLGLLPLLNVTAFWFFSPLTYSQPLTYEQFQKRAWLKLWNLRCVNCPRDGIFIPKDE